VTLKLAGRARVNRWFLAVDDDVAKDRRAAAPKPIDEAGSFIIALVVVEAMPPA